jgi:large subunit ribosomal protein L30
VSGEKLKIEQYRSGIATPENHKRILRALGLGRVHRVVELPDHPGIRGMVARIPHLVRIIDEKP